MKDLNFLLLSSLGSLVLICANLPLFIKSIGSSKLANSQMKQTAQQVELAGFYRTEQEFWNQIKEIDFEQTKKDAEFANVNATVMGILSSELDALETKQKKEERPYFRFLLVGDSIMHSLSVGFQNAMHKAPYNLETIDVDFKISSGLNRIDFYDWFTRTSELLNLHNPDVMVIVFGGNDDQHILDTGGTLRAELTPEWEEAYQERVSRYAEILNQSSVRKVYWVGHPMSNLPRYNKFFPIFNRIYEEVAAEYPQIEFVDCWDIFAQNGDFTPVVTDKSGDKGKVRTNDGIHFTQHGADMVVDVLVEQMIEDYVLRTETADGQDDYQPVVNRSSARQN